MDNLNELKTSGLSNPPSNQDGGSNQDEAKPGARFALKALSTFNVDKALEGELVGNRKLGIIGNAVGEGLYISYSDIAINEIMFQNILMKSSLYMEVKDTQAIYQMTSVEETPAILEGVNVLSSEVITFDKGFNEQFYMGITLSKINYKEGGVIRGSGESIPVVIEFTKSKDGNDDVVELQTSTYELMFTPLKLETVIGDDYADYDIAITKISAGVTDEFFVMHHGVIVIK